MVDGEIAFKHSEALNIYGLFQARASLFQRVGSLTLPRFPSKIFLNCALIRPAPTCCRSPAFARCTPHTRPATHKVYTHKVVKSLEYMVADIISLFNEHSNRIVDALLDSRGEFCPATFLALDDTILRQIEALPRVGEAETQAGATAEERRRLGALRDAQGLLHRLRTRDMCGEGMISASVTLHCPPARLQRKPHEGRRCPAPKQRCPAARHAAPAADSAHFLPTASLRCADPSCRALHACPLAATSRWQTALSLWRTTISI